MAYKEQCQVLQSLILVAKVGHTSTHWPPASQPKPAFSYLPTHLPSYPMIPTTAQVQPLGYAAWPLLVSQRAAVFCLINACVRWQLLLICSQSDHSWPTHHPAAGNACLPKYSLCPVTCSPQEGRDRPSLASYTHHTFLKGWGHPSSKHFMIYS